LNAREQNQSGFYIGAKLISAVGVNFFCEHRTFFLQRYEIFCIFAKKN